MACTTVALQAKVKLPHLIADGMVIQQDTEVRLWGWDTPGKTVRVSPSWTKTVSTARTGSDGTWMVKVRSPKASYKPLSIVFNDGEPLTVKGILAGEEIWLCGGQSNMEMPMGMGHLPY